MKRLWSSIKDLGLKLESGKGEARAWELYQAFCEFVGEISWVFLKYFCSMLLGKRILLGFLGFCAGTFPMLRTLLPEVSGVVPFCVCE